MRRRNRDKLSLKLRNKIARQVRIKQQLGLNQWAMECYKTTNDFHTINILILISKITRRSAKYLLKIIKKKTLLLPESLISVNDRYYKVGKFTVNARNEWCIYTIL